jgi:hypothetical protein
VERIEKTNLNPVSFLFYGGKISKIETFLPGKTNKRKEKLAKTLLVFSRDFAGISKMRGQIIFGRPTAPFYPV